MADQEGAEGPRGEDPVWGAPRPGGGRDPADSREAERPGTERTGLRNPQGPVPGGHGCGGGRRQHGGLARVEDPGNDGVAHGGGRFRGARALPAAALLLLLVGGQGVQGRPPEFNREQWFTDFGNRTDGPGFLAEPQAGDHPWIRRVEPPRIDPNEPFASLMQRLEELRPGWKRTDPFYKWVPGDDWEEAVRWRQEKSNEPIYPLVEFPEEMQGYRVPQGYNTWRAFQEGDRSLPWGSRGTLEPLYGELANYMDALINDIDELATRRRNYHGFLRQRTWWSRPAQTESLYPPASVPEKHWLSVLHRNHLQGRERFIHYLPPSVHRPHQQEPGFPREVWPSEGQPWNERADHSTQGTFGTPVVDITFTADRNGARTEEQEPGPYAITTRDRATQTPFEHEPNRPGPRQQYSFGNLVRVSGRLWEDSSTGASFIAPADPRSRRRGVFYDRFLAPRSAAELWWNFCIGNASPRMRSPSNSASPAPPVCREPEGLGYSGDEEEDRTEPPAAILDWEGVYSGDSDTENGSSDEESSEVLQIGPSDDSSDEMEV